MTGTGLTRTVFTRAVLTGAFCSVFAIAVDALMDQLSMVQVMLAAAISGFLGSLFAHFVLSRARP